MFNKKLTGIKRILSLGFVFIIALSGAITASANAVKATPNMTNYTYTYDWWYEPVQSPDAYYATDEIMGVNFGEKNFSDAQGLFIQDNRIYICDSGNNRIVLIEAKPDGKYELKKICESVIIDGEESNFKYPTDIYETETGLLYVADMNNNRILVLDINFNYVSTINKPVTESIDEATTFSPNKLIVDEANRCYVQANGINKGLLEFDGQGDFTGFVGANKVQVDMLDYFWKTYMSTDAQRAQMENFVPTEYNNVFLDYDGFIYTTTSTFDQGLIETADPVRRLNATGADILIRKGYFAPIGDLNWSSGGGISGSSRFVDVVAFENDSYACLDKTRSRLFMYDFQGNLLYVFGGIGNKKGYFLTPSAVDSMGYSIFVLDSRSATLTRFELTEFGTYIKDAMDFYKVGKYEDSALMWDEVLKRNGNYDLAYIGKGRAALRQGEYQLAMDYYKIKRDAESYGKAFQLYRKQWMEENIVTVLIVVIVIVVAYKLLRFFIKKNKKKKV